MLKGNLLLIDDDQDFLETMAFELRELGLDVITCSNLQQVQEVIIENDHLDYAIVDLRLGTDSGLSIIALIRNRYPPCHITMLTAFGTIATTVEAMKRGSDNYIMKPCSTEEILAALNIGPNNSSKIEAQGLELPDLYRKEREYIDYILQMKKGNISHAAEALGIKRQSLQRKLRKFIPKY